MRLETIVEMVDVALVATRGPLITVVEEALPIVVVAVPVVLILVVPLRLVEPFTDKPVRLIPEFQAGVPEALMVRIWFCEPGRSGTLFCCSFPTSRAP